MAAPPCPGASERVGVLGGTFDPPHVVHLDLARAARAQFRLDRVLLIVAGDPWQKEGAVAAAAADRLAMVEAAVEGEPGLEASAIEVERAGPTYTADTLEALAAPGRELFLIVGADVASRLDTWHEPDRVRRGCTLLVADRPGGPGSAGAVVAELEADGWAAEVLDMTPVDLSSTALRDRLASGESVDGLMPPAVVRVVRERGLYTRLR